MTEQVKERQVILTLIFFSRRNQYDFSFNQPLIDKEVEKTKRVYGLKKIAFFYSQWIKQKSIKKITLESTLPQEIHPSLLKCPLWIYTKFTSKLLN